MIAIVELLAPTFCSFLELLHTINIIPGQEKVLINLKLLANIY